MLCLRYSLVDVYICRLEYQIYEDEYDAELIRLLDYRKQEKMAYLQPVFGVVV